MSVLRVLIVEDTPERQEVLTQLFRAHAWMLVHTGRRAITLLKAYDFDLLSLDYNLRGELTGETVARALLDTRNASVRVLVHSLNPRGRARILEIIPQAVVYPESRMVRSNEVFKQLRASLDAGEWPFRGQQEQGAEG